MTDNKVNMALDDIIKMNKKQEKAKVTRKVRGKPQLKGNAAKVAGARKQVMRKTKNAAPSAPLAAAQTKRLVQRLVKKALKTRLAAQALRSNALPRRGGVRPRAVPVRNAIARVNPRSRVIAQRRAVVQPIAPAAIVRRGRGFVQPRTVVYQNEYVTPVVQRVVAPRVVIPTAPRQRVVVRRQIQRQAQRQAPRHLARQNVLVQPQRIIVQPQRIVRPAGRNQVIVAQPQRVQRVQQRAIRRRQPQAAPPPRVEYVQNFRQNRNRNNVVRGERVRKNERFRTAIGGSRMYQQQIVDRFEPSTSFISSGAVVRRGRGFNNGY